MSDAMTNREIEDVLSSIRKLVAQSPVAAAQAAPSSRLILTPAFRVDTPEDNSAALRPALPKPAADTTDIAARETIGQPGQARVGTEQAAMEQAGTEQSGATEDRDAEESAVQAATDVSQPEASPARPAARVPALLLVGGTQAHRPDPDAAVYQVRASYTADAALAGELLTGDTLADGFVSDSALTDDPHTEAWAGEPDTPEDIAREEAAEAARRHASTAAVAALRLAVRAPDQSDDDPDADSRNASLARTIAELEAAIAATGQDWEPDGSEDAAAATPDAASAHLVQDTQSATAAQNHDEGTARGAAYETEAQTSAGFDDTVVAAPWTRPGARLHDIVKSDDGDFDVTVVVAQGHDTGVDAAHPEADEIDADDQDTDDLDEAVIDEDMLRDLVARIVREELQGHLGERITRNVRKLIRAEIARALASRSFD